ncbi:MAG: MBOAT family O-acyltransferase [Pseudomonadota bacterium]
MLASIIINYFVGLAIGVSEHKQRWLVVGLLYNLFVLINFKYLGFLMSQLAPGTPVAELANHIHLPLGISFFTFQCISYLIDVYRGDIKSERSFLKVATYISMFPQLVAGPIVRYASIKADMDQPNISALNYYYAVLFFCIGLGQKVLIADTLGNFADPLFAAWKAIDNVTAWLAAVSYSLQIFFDFAGYSNMAIGIGYLMGFEFPQNFNKPYMAKSFTEFWRRWHISLSTWFRDYLYIPLGGNQGSYLQTYRNLLIVFLLCGLWHGASWVFIIWGLFHGCFLIIERIGFKQILEKLPSFFQHFYLLLLVVIAWVIFRSESTDQTITILGKMFGFISGGLMSYNAYYTHEIAIVLILGFIFSTRFVENAVSHFIALPARRGMWDKERKNKIAYIAGLTWAILLFCLSVIKIQAGVNSPFLYFRF